MLVFRLRVLFTKPSSRFLVFFPVEATMKKTLAMTCTLLALTAGIAAAGPGGLNLGWDDCGGLPATLNRAFACNANSGVGTSSTLVGSFVASCCITQATSNEIVVDVQTPGATLTPWWNMRTGAPVGCRSGALTASYSFTAGPFTCYDYWGGAAFGSVSSDAPIGNRVRLKGLVALPPTSPRVGPIVEGTETYSFKFIISAAKTTGLGACAGCSSGACILLNTIKVLQPVGNPGGTKFISAPATRNFVTWQGGIPATDCQLATPAKNTTWGSIKTFYR
jgi:hypothetical protein